MDWNPDKGRVLTVPVTKLESTGGIVYLHTHRGDSSAEIAESLVPYIGREMNANLPNDYGYYKNYRVTLIAVDGESVTVEEMRSGIIRTYAAFDVFGSDGHATVIRPEPKN